LAEIVAFECKNDRDKLAEFSKIFYGDYEHTTRTVIDVDAMNGPTTVYIDGKKAKGYITKYSVSHDVNSYSSFSSKSYHMQAPSFTLDIEVKGSF
jgi:hypothetical protein